MSSGDQQASRRSRRGLGSGGLSGGTRGWLLGLRGRGCDGEGVDGCGQVNERADRCVFVVEQGLFDLAFEQGLVGGRDRRPFFGFPLAVRQMGWSIRITGNQIVQMLEGGVGVTTCVVNRKETDFEFSDGGVVEGGSDLVEVGQWCTHLHVAGFVQGVEGVAGLVRVVSGDGARVG